MKKESSRPCIVVGVSGSIAAYKAADIVGRLVKAGCTVRVAMTENAARFIAPLTLATLSRNPVMTGPLDEGPGWKPGHIELADCADLLLIAPATANTIAELACGFAFSAIGEIALATHAPLLVAPAMNGKMWLHPATQENVARLKTRGADFIGPEEGMLACGYEGIGRLWQPEAIANRALEICRQNSI